MDRRQKIDYSGVDWNACDIDISKSMGITRQAVGRARKKYSSIKSDCKKRLRLGVDGYPTEKCLKNIARWTGDHLALMATIKPMWAYQNWEELQVEDYMGRPEREFRLATSGWSGNESIIAALRENRPFWAMHWYLSQRGGLHVFHIGICEQASR